MVTEVFRDLATEFVERKSHDSSSLTNQRIVVTSCEVRTVDRLADPGSVYDSQLNAIPQEVNSTASASDSTAKRPITPSY